jgi:starch phosphorylase
VKGYFDQRIRLDGWQEDSDEDLDPPHLPVVPMAGLNGGPGIAVVNTFGRAVHVRAWKIRVGRVPIYLLDTNLEENHPDDRGCSTSFTVAAKTCAFARNGSSARVGCACCARSALSRWCGTANEGHAAFMLLERVRELVAGGIGFDEAVKQVRASSVFTTHTPVPAGHDTFAEEQVAECMGPIWDDLGVSRERLMGLAVNPLHGTGRFHMTVLSIRLSRQVNGVSERHGAVSRTMWSSLWPGEPVDQVPIGSVTNGVHMATWMSNAMMELLDRHLGADWWTRLEDPMLLERIAQLDPAELWAVHRYLKGVLHRFMREDARRRFADNWKEATQVVGAGRCCWSRTRSRSDSRGVFATYKRANLIFSDPERLHRLLVNPRQPVQLVVAGKAHPAILRARKCCRRCTDSPTIRSTKDGWRLWRTMDVSGPRDGTGRGSLAESPPGAARGERNQRDEGRHSTACPSLSTIDGWWEEGFDGTNGWALPRAAESLSIEETDREDANALYRVLEEEIVPTYYDRDARGIPPAWVDRMRNALRVAASRFTAHRMVRDYTERYYAPAMRGLDLHDDPPRA